jgi:hypothetical protein
MTDQELQQWFEDIWADREERIYPAFFGDVGGAGKGIYNLSIETFKSLGHPDPDPRYLTHGVLECPPTDSRKDWLYVSSGMSNPWGESPETVDPNNYSGLGMEFTLHTPGQARWAIEVLHHVMAVQLLVAAGEINGPLVEHNDRIPLGGSLWKKNGTITHLLVTYPPEPPEGYPARFELASGKVDVMLIIGITQRERDFAHTQGVEPLIGLLRHQGIFPVTDPERLSTV